MKSFETHGDKKIHLIIDPKTAHIKLKFSNGGEMPAELAGLFTSEREAEFAVNLYLDKTKPKVNK